MTVRVNNTTSKLEAAFWEFHLANPEVYEELKRLSLRLKARGYERLGIATVFEVCRWRSMMRARDNKGFKLNNNHRAFYARLLNREPGLEGIFTTRKQGVESHVA